MNSLAKTNGNMTSSMPSLLTDFFSDDIFRWPFRQLRPDASTLPTVNIWETPDAFQIEVAAPGMKREDFKVELDNNVLSISSERQHQSENDDKNANCLRREFNYQAFERVFRLPGEQVDNAKVQARYAEGILQINIPKREEARRKPVKQIKVG